MIYLKVENKVVLLSTLRAIDVTVPLEKDYRGKDATEPYAIAHLLSSLAQIPGVLTFPLELLHRKPPCDRPDFVLSMGTRKVGIEHVDARPESETRKSNLRNKEGVGPLACFEVPVEPSELARSAEELRGEMIANDYGGGWGDQDGTDRKWAQVMLYWIGHKEHKLRCYSRYDEDWLLIRDAWPFPSVNHQNATSHLFWQIRERSTRLEFHRVFIISSENRGPICEVSESGFHLHPRNDLWVKRLLG